MASHEIFLKFLRWRVSDGLSFDLWKDPWLPTSGFQVISPKPHVGCVKVVYLIDPSSRTWKAFLVRNIFIFLDLLSDFAYPDNLFWDFKSNGQCFAKSAYNLIIRSKLLL